MPRRAAVSDSDVMAAIHAATYGGKDAWGADVFGLQLGLPGVFGLLHPAGGMILARVAAEEAEILTLAVVPAARRNGIATKLLSEVTKLVADMGAAIIFLEVSVMNIAARRLYTGFGFEKAGLRRRYYSDMSDALVLRLDLLAGR